MYTGAGIYITMDSKRMSMLDQEKTKMLFFANQLHQDERNNDCA
jgi:hypothetical protein